MVSPTCRGRSTGTVSSTSPRDSFSRRSWPCGPTGPATSSKTHVGWTHRRAAPLTPSPLLVGDELYLVTDAGIASCLDASDGRDPVAAAAQRDVLGVAGLRRRPHLLSCRRRRRDSHRTGPTVSAPGDQHARWRDAGVDGDRWRVDLHSIGNSPLPNRRDPVMSQWIGYGCAPAAGDSRPDVRHVPPTWSTCPGDCGRRTGSGADRHRPRQAGVRTRDRA